MSTKNNSLIHFSGVDNFDLITTDYETGVTSVVVYTRHYRNGVLHRDDGAAVLLGGKPHQYWVNGRQHTKDEYDHFLEKKKLKERLESNLGKKGLIKKGKI